MLQQIDRRLQDIVYPAAGAGALLSARSGDMYRLMEVRTLRSQPDQPIEFSGFGAWSSAQPPSLLDEFLGFRENLLLREGGVGIFCFESCAHGRRRIDKYLRPGWVLIIPGSHAATGSLKEFLNRFDEV